MYLLLFFITGLLFIQNNSLHAEMYKWTDANGRVTYSNVTPPTTAQRVEKIEAIHRPEQQTGDRGGVGQRKRKHTKPQKPPVNVKPRPGSSVSDQILIDQIRAQQRQIETMQRDQKQVLMDLQRRQDMEQMRLQEMNRENIIPRKKKRRGGGRTRHVDVPPVSGLYPPGHPVPPPGVGLPPTGGILPGFAPPGQPVLYGQPGMQGGAFPPPLDGSGGIRP